MQNVSPAPTNCQFYAATGNVTQAQTTISGVSTSNNLTIVAGMAVSVSSGSSPFPANDTIASITYNSVTHVILTITMFSAATTTQASASLQFSYDNGGSIIGDNEGGGASTCFSRASSNYGPQEWGAMQNYNPTGSPSNGNDDTSSLQNWVNANQPHVATPGNSRITSPLYCNGTSISGPPRTGTTEINGPVPLFQIFSDNSGGGFSSSATPALLVMDYPSNTTGGCAAHDVGLIASDHQTTGGVSTPYDTVDAYGQADLVDGSFLYGGNVNFHCIGAGEDVQLFDSFVTSSVNDDIDSNCPDFRVERNVIAQAGSGANNSAVG
ncbi:MAG TPA: hypothetical protein VII49_06885, partial [Rhizomicrobium sp.]